MKRVNTVEIDLKDIEEDLVDKPLLGPNSKDKEFKGEKLKKGNGKANFKRLISMAKPEWWLITIGTIALFIGSGIFLIIPWAAGVVVDMVLEPGSTNITIEQGIIILAVAFTIGAICTLFRVTSFTVAGERVVARMRKHLFQSIIQQEIGFFDITRTGELMNRLSSDTTVMQNAVTVNISLCLRNVAQAIGSLILLFVISWKLTIVMLLSVPIVIAGAVVFGLFLKKLSKKTQDALARASEVSEESLSNIRTVRSFSKEYFEMEKYFNEVEESYRLGKQKGYAMGGFAGGATFFIQFSFGLVLFYGAYLVAVTKEISPGDLTAFLIYTLSVAISFGSLSMLYGDFMKAIGASERVFELIDRKPPVKFEGGLKPDRLEGRIVFNDVKFSYPSRLNQSVLKGINLNLDPGSVVALVGPSGGGKSTIANLIELFYYPTDGYITLDGKDLKDYDPFWIHEKIGIVSQGPCLFAATIKENIAYGLKDVPMEKIIHAAKIANAHEFIVNFHQGYDTMVGERGVRLSGGQKQRIAIARAMLKDPKILLLDEATSDLDAESEHLVQEALDRIMEGRTVLVIAHRLSTVRNANKIIVIKEGVIAEEGTHEELMILNGTYVQLVSHQLQA